MKIAIKALVDQLKDYKRYITYNKERMVYHKGEVEKLEKGILIYEIEKENLEKELEILKNIK